MVRIRVAARIFPEDEYLKNIRCGKVIASPVKDEKRLVVVVREPYQWQIGTLVLEIQRAYRSCYQRDLPTVKYLKDTDDFDIDLQSYVSDVLLDEGRAQTDASDQRVTVNLVLEQGRRVREGSVAVGSQLEDSRYQIQLDSTSRPPVPTFPGLSSALGKRPFSATDNHTSFSVGTKRARHVDIPETLGEEQELLYSIEHDEPAGSLELVKGTQYSNPEQEHERQHGLVEPKDESPEMRRLLEDIPPATVDELEELPEQPPNFERKRKGRITSPTKQSSQQARTPNGVVTSAAHPALRRHERSQAPITPPSESSRLHSDSARLQDHPSADAAKSAAQLSVSASKFKRGDVYDYPESEIDDSQMSPRSKQTSSSHRKANDGLSRIESLQSPEVERGEDQRLSISQAIDTLDDESIFDDERSLDQTFKTPEVIPHEESSGSLDENEIRIYEDPEIDDRESRQKDTTVSQKLNGRATPKPAATGVKENMLSQPVASVSNGTTSNGKITAEKVPANATEAATSKPLRKRIRGKYKRKSDNISIEGDATSVVNGSVNDSSQPEGINEEESAPENQRPAKKAKSLRKTPSLDSPGEQLSQNLQASTERLSMRAVNKKLAGVETNPQSATPSKKGQESILNVSAKKTASKTLNGTSAKQNASTDSARDKLKKQVTTDLASSPSQNIVVQRAEHMIDSSPALPKPLPNWGSSVPASAEKGKPPTGGKDDRLNVHQQDDSRKSPSVGIGLSAEELKTVASRMGLTNEQYAADKKRKLQESKKQAEKQRKEEAAADKRKRTSTGDRLPKEESSKSIEPNADEAKPNTTSKKKNRKSLPVEEGSKASLERTTTETSATSSSTGDSKQLTKKLGSEKIASSRRESTPASSSKVPTAKSGVRANTPTKKVAKSPSVQSASIDKVSKPAIGQSKREKTPAKTAKKAPSVMSVNIDKTPKLAVQPSKADKTPSTSLARKSTPAPSTSKKPETKPTEQIWAKTPQLGGRYNQTMKDLHKGILKADKVSDLPKPTLLSRIKQTQKTPVFEIEDENEDDEESEESSEEEEEEVQPKTLAKNVAQYKKTVQTKQRLEDSEESSDDSEDDKKPTLGKVATPSTAAKKGTLSGKPDPSIRDRSVDSDEEDDDDDDDEL